MLNRRISNGIMGEPEQRRNAVPAHVTNPDGGAMVETSKGMWTSRFCNCPSQDEDGAYCPICGKLKKPAEPVGNAEEWPE